MWLQDISPEQLAEFFHRYQQVLERDFKCAAKSRADSWDNMSSAERSNEIASARLTLSESDSTRSKRANRYFATPGEAEWGC